MAVLAVADTREALERYAAHILRQWGPLVIAVTGATGKTTTKEAIADLLAARAPTFRSWRNYNDLLGLPLSLGRLEPAHRYAVMELGADHPGEIARAVRASPSRVSASSPTSARRICSISARWRRSPRSWRELPAALPPDGVAVLNAMMRPCARWRWHVRARALLRRHYATVRRRLRRAWICPYV